MGLKSAIEPTPRRAPMLLNTRSLSSATHLQSSWASPGRLKSGTGRIPPGGSSRSDSRDTVSLRALDRLSWANDRKAPAFDKAGNTVDLMNLAALALMVLIMRNSPGLG